MASSSTTPSKRRPRALAVLAVAAACAALVGRCVKIETAESLTDLGWGAPDIHFVHALPQADHALGAASSPEQDVFVPKTAAEWRKYAQWAETHQGAGVDEEAVREQLGVFWRDEVALMHSADGRAWRCYHEQRPFVSQETRQRRAARRAEHGAGPDKEATPLQAQAVEEYFDARDYAEAEALLHEEMKHGTQCLVFDGAEYSYRLCPNKYAEQTRVGADNRVLEKYVLGRFGKDDNRVHDRAMRDAARRRGSLAWIAAGDEPAGTHVTRFEHDARGRRYVQFYSGGDACWATKLPRVAEVVYTCANRSGTTTPSIASVAEKSPCQYVISVRSPALCKHPFFAKPFGLADNVAGDHDAAAAHDDSDPERLVLCVADRTPQELEQGGVVRSRPRRSTVMGEQAKKTEVKAKTADDKVDGKAEDKKGKKDDKELEAEQLLEAFLRVFGPQGKNVKIKTFKAAVPQQEANNQQEEEQEDEQQVEKEQEEEGEGEYEDDGYEDDDFGDGDGGDEEDELLELLGVL